MSFITMAIRYLSLYSGQTFRQNFSFLLSLLNSLGKAIQLQYLILLQFQDQTYLGVYRDVYYGEDSHSIQNTNGIIVQTYTIDYNWSKPPEKQQCEKLPLYTSLYIPQEDAVVRLLYIYVINNLIYILQLRFFINNGLYTAYLNNLEILTALLPVQVVVYTYIYMRSHMYFCRERDKESLVGSDISTKRITVQKSWTKGLLTRPAQQNLPRESTLEDHLLKVLALILVSVLVLFAPKLPNSMLPFPQCLLHFSKASNQ